MTESERRVVMMAVGTTCGIALTLPMSTARGTRPGNVRAVTRWSSVGYAMDALDEPTRLTVAEENRILAVQTP